MTDAMKHSLPIAEYRLPIYIEWDKQNFPCPHNPEGWVAYHNCLVAQDFLDNNPEDKLDWEENQ